MTFCLFIHIWALAGILLCVLAVLGIAKLCVIGPPGLEAWVRYRLRHLLEYIRVRRKLREARREIQRESRRAEEVSHLTRRYKTPLG